jgi:hypothetical protein
MPWVVTPFGGRQTWRDASTKGFRTWTGDLVRGLRAASRDGAAEEVTTEARRIDPSAAMAEVLAAAFRAPAPT